MKTKVLISTLSLAMAALASDAYALETISGTVRSATTSQVLASIDLDVFDGNGTAVTITGGTTDASGNYTIVLPGPGTYIVRADPATTQPYGAVYYGGTPLKSQATPLVLLTGSAVTGIDFSLPDGFLVTGTVDSAGTGLADMDIDVFASNGEFLSAYPARTLLDGTYVVGALPAGTYFIRADPDITRPDQLFVRTYFGGTSDIASATPVVVGASNVSAVDITLPSGGTIQGTVTEAGTGVPLADLDLDVFDAIGNPVSVQARTAIDGTYEIGAMAPGVYLLRVDPTVAQGYARTYYPASATAGGAMGIDVFAGTRTMNVDFAIGVGGTLSGTIRLAADGTAIANVDTDLFDVNGNFMAGYTAKSDTVGAFQLGPMMPGTYFVRADPTVLQGLAEQFYAGKTDISFADPIAVTAGADTGGIDFSLVDAGAISGTIRDAALVPIAGIDLDLFDVNGTRLRKGAASGLDGTYTFASLTPGDYTLRADPTAAQGFARAYFDGRLTRALADVVTVVAGTPTVGIDFTLAPGGTLSGQVTDSGGTPVANIDIDVFQVQAGTFLRMDQGAITDATGSYLLEALPAGDYIVRAQPDPLISPPIYYGDTTDQTLATLIPLAAGADVIGIDIAIPATSGTGVCGDPFFVVTASVVQGSRLVTATDALVTLRAAVGLDVCLLCVCDVDGSGAVSANDALAVLQTAVGRSVPFNCPPCL